jgi:serine/threonine protein kinase
VSARAASTPPEIPGFTPVELLGTGGFADVFLYEQHVPRRRVAVKVLLAEGLAAGSAEAFAAEADIMAQLSTHPSIVTIYQAGVAADGRPFLVMEYCPKPNLQVRYRAERFSVAEALRVGVQVSAAVETAHRAGILHRDIKPANILVTEYSRPALADFGIAATTSSDAQSEGMSIPWSPPESFAEPPRGDVTSDVWALGATVYTLLAGRSPFEQPGASNSGADLIARIEAAALAPTGRADVPESLERVLARAMSKSPASRYASAIDLARALQRVQIELRQSVTPIDVVDDVGPAAPAPAAEDDDESTRIRSVVSIDPGSAASPAVTGVPRGVGEPAAAGLEHTVIRSSSSLPRWGAAQPTPPAPADDDATRMRAPVAVSPDAAAAAGAGAPIDSARAGAAAPGATPRGRRRGAVIGWSIGGSLAAAALIAGGVIAVTSGALTPGEREPEAGETPDSVPVDVVVPGAGVPRVTELAATATEEGIRFTWANPDPQPGDAYLWGLVRPGEETEYSVIEQPEVVVVPEGAGPSCIEVILRRDDGRSAADGATVCGP